MKKFIAFFPAFLALWMFAHAAHAEIIGSVDTVWKMIGANHAVTVEVFDDPKISGVSCFLSRPKAGGLLGAVGLATEKSDNSIACRQTGPITVDETFEPGENVFEESTSILFKELKVARFFDEKRNTLVYLTYTTYLIDGSAKSSISVVVIRPW